MCAIHSCSSHGVLREIFAVAVAAVSAKYIGVSPFRRATPGATVTRSDSPLIC